MDKPSSEPGSSVPNSFDFTASNRSTPNHTPEHTNPDSIGSDQTISNHTNCDNGTVFEHNTSTSADFTSESGKFYSAFTLSKNQREEIDIAFGIFDTKRCGFIELNELKFAGRALSFELTQEEIEHMPIHIGDDEVARVSLKDFLMLMSGKMLERDTLAAKKKELKFFDGNRVITITGESLKRVANMLGETLTDDELYELLNQ